MKGKKSHLKLYVGRTLWTTTGETVIVTGLTKEEIFVKYKNKIHRRPRSIVGDKLYFVPIRQPTVQPEVYPVIQPTCASCLFLKTEVCMGKAQSCDDYKPAPDVPKDERDHWPEYGDATMFRMGRGYWRR